MGLGMVRIAQGGWRDRRGAAAMEFALVAPLLTMMIVGIVQYSVLFFTYNSMLNAARSGARSVSIGARTTATVIADMKSGLPGWVPADSVTATAVETTVSGATRVTTTVTIPAANGTMLGLLPMPTNLQARAVMVKEV